MGARHASCAVRGQRPLPGGDDVDQQIAHWVRREVLKEHNWDLGNYAEVEARLVVECERAKIRLATEEETRIEISQIDPQCPLAAEGFALRRSVLDSLAADLVRRTFVACDHALRSAGLSAHELSGVFLAGGSTHLRAVRQGVEDYFGRSGCIDVEPTSVVAMGASLAQP